jgi:hypothetical protein
MGDVIRFPPRLRLLPPGGIVSAIVPPGYRAAPCPLVAQMRKLGIPLTRENYIAIATNDGELDWGAEHDANLPLHELVDD